MRKINKKTIVLVASLLLVLSIGIGTTVAFLLDKTDSLVNTFTPSRVTTDVDEKITVNGKEDVTVKNTGNTPAYIRAAVVITWQNSDGDVHMQQPVAGTDYSIEYVLGTVGAADNWFMGDDGFYYFTSPIEPDASTDVLIKSCTYSANAPENYALCVEIIGSGVQAVPAAAVEAWSNNMYTIGTGDVLVKK